METKFTITLVSESPSYEVVGNMDTTLEMVWNSQKHWFAPGTKVIIQDNFGRSETFVKETKTR